MDKHMKSASVGKSPKRPDGRAKVDGSAIYLDDLPFSGFMGTTIRSPYASARIRSIDAEEARAEPDVVVITAADLRVSNAIKLIAEDWPVLAQDQVDHVGQAVVLVAAPTLDRARDAAAKVKIEYEELPAILTLDDALQGDPRTGGELNVQARCSIENGDIDAGFAQSARIIEGTYETGHQEHIYIEPNGMIAISHPDETLEVIGSMQCPYYVHKALTHLFNVDDEKIRVRQTTTGGGFGGKEDYPDVIAAHACLLAQACDQPVKIIYDRHEDIIGTTKRHPSRVHHRTGVDADGKLLAMDIEVLFDGGAYVTLSPVVLSRGVIHAAGAYSCPNVRINGRVLATNTAPNGAFRGFGAPQTAFAIERHMDRIGRELGIDPYTIRHKNAYRVGDITPTGQHLDGSVSAIECLEKACENSGFLEKWLKYEKRRGQRFDSGEPWQGIGLSLFWHGAGFTGNGERNMLARAALRLATDGAVEILAASTEIGQGKDMVFSQIVADAIGVPVSRVRMGACDTSEVPDSGPTVASRTVMVVGGVLAQAGRSLGQQLCVILAAKHGLDASSVSLRDDAFWDAQGNSLGSFQEVTRRVVDEDGGLHVEEQFQPSDDDQGFDEETYRGAAYSDYGWGCDVVELEVDPDTLTTTPNHVTAACDVGQAIHPILCAGQVEGGTLQAVAYGYLEEVKMENGRYLNDRLQTYIVPTTQDSPSFDTILVENPGGGPFGAKGVGELPMDGGAPAVVAAIENATGVAPVAIPATPERLLDDIQAGRVVTGSPQFTELDTTKPTVDYTEI
ncbi:MAG: hypothetical protein CMH54_04965 [Myxococcales bacterium]|nr:hypothetical protein [Myxococcales bacterium]